MMRRLRASFAASFGLAMIAFGAATNADGPQAGADFFEKEVRPILVEHCAKCHGNDKPKGGLNLSTRAALLQGGESGPAAVAGKPGESAILHAVRYEADPKMPPKGKLDDRAIASLTKWVEIGLPWPESKVEPAAPGKAYQITEAQKQFWSFRPIADPPVPAVADASWPKTDIDRFLLAAMEAKGLKPAAPADKRTLIRRATFDLTGLPPAVEDIKAFLADDSPEAFAKVIDRLLATPQYGERWGRHWLDLVRYADSRDARGVGGGDDIADAWRYRDWVVSAFNRDLPYDRFIKEQIAGDTSPGPDPTDLNPEGLVATGFLSIGEWGAGDADKEKMITDIVDDQVDAVGRAFLGLTIACARCHDHKFDPIPTADYYGLAGIFFSSRIIPDPGNKSAGSPMLRTPIETKSEMAARARHGQEMAALDAQLKAETEAAAVAAARSLLPDTAKYLEAAWDVAHPSPNGTGSTPAEVAASRKLRPEVLKSWLAYLDPGGDGPLLGQAVPNVAGVAGVMAWTGQGADASVTINSNPQEIARLTFKLPPRSVSAHPSPTRGVAVAWESPISGTVKVSGRLTDGDPVCGDGIAWDLVHRGIGGTKPLASGDIANGGAQALDGGDSSRLATIEVRKGEVIRLTIQPKGSHACDTTAIALTVRSADGASSWDLAGDVAPSPADGNPHADRLGHPGVWRFSEAVDSSAVGPLPSQVVAWKEAVAGNDRAVVSAASHAVQSALDRPPTDASAASLRDALVGPKGPLRAGAAAAFPAEVASRLAQIRASLDKLKANPPPAVPLALAALEGGVPNSAHAGFHDARIHVRGNYQRLGETVPRHFPRIIAGDSVPTITQGSGRRELADWIARPDHPLTARVMANRIWQYHFGEGIVRTPSNYGKLGEPPSHPELLDRLAGRFVASGWSVKAMHRAIMLSGAYQQSSAATADGARIDPENRLFGRMNRRRLESEALRDALLAASGRLDPAMGGLAYRDFSVPRRTLYFMTIRSDRSSFGPLFDAADSTAMVDRRTVSTVAPQALFLLNNPFVLDQARALAERTLKEPDTDDRGRIERLYERLYGRPAREDEVRIGLKATEGDDRAAKWEAYCQVLLCGNEFLYVD